MERCLELARLGRGSVAPNPMVGAVIVHQDQIIGEGYHEKYGKAHAEVNAVNAVPDALKKCLPDSTIYVSLEPCAHYGKTPPCADIIVKSGIKNVVIGTTDPFSEVAGKGVQKLKEAGCNVQEDILRARCQLLNKRFFTFHQQKRPYVVLKWAQTADGFIAKEDYSSKWISGTWSRKLVHKWRSEESAILTGTNTVKFDNPALDVRDWTGQDSVRLIIDENLGLDKKLKVFDDEQKTIVFNAQNAERKGNTKWVQLDFEQDILPQLYRYLYEQDIQSVLVEGGSYLLNKIIDNSSWDEARVFTAPVCFKRGIAAPHIKDGELFESRKIKEDMLQVYYSAR